MMFWFQKPFVLLMMKSITINWLINKSWKIANSELHCRNFEFFYATLIVDSRNIGDVISDKFFANHLIQIPIN